ncbi:single-stranded DNA-binding protein [Bacillus solimangrovi]|uniref:Single-stranded DNA-binding protein n=1 Tax=Bacillus solimangrovi TaxID=1305675 RepID=A0A1E5LCC4_9BACI|nr:single-stranded DNA-binding protein [Bacillus solimangrovi]OEH91740.1 single-stranded DNA-binding protein [Bacillus solimangrovi]
MLNRVVLVGRLTKDPELRYTPSGVAVAKFTLAVNRTFTNQQGERDADFINVVVWRRQAENAANYLKKGSLAGVDGRIQTSSYDNQEGRRVFMTEVVAESVQFLEPRGATGQSSAPSYEQDFGPTGGGFNPNQNQQRQNNTDFSRKNDANPFGDEEKIDISDDDLPF